MDAAPQQEERTRRGAQSERVSTEEVQVPRPADGMDLPQLLPLLLLLSGCLPKVSHL